MTKIYDISQTIKEGMPIWPGDTEYAADPTWILEGGCPVNVSKLTLSSHTGTHADAPLHYGNHGVPVDGLSLTPYLGLCHVIDGDAGLAQLPEKLERVLLKQFKTYPHNVWPVDFPTPTSDFIDGLAARGCQLIGVESPSIDPETSKNLPCHKAVERHGMAILEGLVLTDVPCGTYELIALPLKLAEVDASPVRAILREIKSA